jgi:polyisoprenoid-binding protein YceI
MKHKHGLVLTLGLLLLLNVSAWAAPKTMKVDAGDAGNKVSFTSDAPVELIHGNTSKITGNITYDDSLKFDPKHPFKVNFDVDLASIDTGIPLRNEHMRDNFLETAKFPKASFKVSQLMGKAMPPLKPGQKVTLTSLGSFSLHGKTMTKKIPVTVTIRGDKLRIQSTFPVRLSDFDIKRPEVVFQKLAETVFVTVDVMAEAP